MEHEQFVIKERNIDYIQRYNQCLARLKRGLPVIPLEYEIRLTKKCNLKCPSCTIINDGTELDTAQIKQILKKISDYKATVMLTGGEPFLREDLVELINYTKELNLTGTIVTNGTIVDLNILDAIISSGLDLMVSLNGSSKEVHERLKGLNTFDNVIKMIKYVKNKGKKAKVHFVIQDGNVHDIYNTCKLCEQLGVDEFHCEPANYFSRALSNKGLKILKDEIKKYLQGRYYLTLDYFDSEFEFLGLVLKGSCDEDIIAGQPLKTLMEKNKVPCYYCLDSCFIDSDGEVVPCTRFADVQFFKEGQKVKYGNVLYSETKDILRNAIAFQISPYVDLKKEERYACQSCMEFLKNLKVYNELNEEKLHVSSNLIDEYAKIWVKNDDFKFYKNLIHKNKEVFEKGIIFFCDDKEIKELLDEAVKVGFNSVFLKKQHQYIRYKK